MNMKRVEVITPSRLHFALIDLNGELGRADGGAGVALEKPNTRIAVEKSDTRKHEVMGASDGRKRQIGRVLGLFKGFFRVKVEEEIPAHVGLGSTTQLLLAVAKACDEFGGKSREREMAGGGAQLGGKHSIGKLAQLVGRGGTSGIGVKAFESGGFAVDAGHSFGIEEKKQSFLPSSASRALPPEAIFHAQLPKNWLFVCTVPEVKEKIYGKKEVNAFKKHCPIAGSEVGKASRIVLMKMIPSVVEKDAVSFGQSLDLLQECGFKKIEWKYQAKKTREAKDRMGRECLGAGLSSFGPLVFGFTDKAKAARRIKSGLEDGFIARTSERGAVVSDAD